MAFAYPVSLEVAGRRAVVIGGVPGAVAEERTRALLDAGACVTVIAERPTEGLEGLGRQGAVTLVRRTYRRGDLRGAFLAVAATGDAAVNGRIFAEAEKRRVLLNAVDDNRHCHFAVPSILRRGDLVVAVSTGGKSPALARRLRLALARDIGPEYGVLVDLLGEVRKELFEQRTADPATWARRWHQALDHDLIGLVRQGRVGEAMALVRTIVGDERPQEAVA